MTYRDPRDEQIERLRERVAQLEAELLNETPELPGAKEPKPVGPIVISAGKKKFVTSCTKCAARFEYVMIHLDGDWIKCPECGNKNLHYGTNAR